MTVERHQTKSGNRWTARVDLGPDPLNGKRRQRKKTFKTAKEAHAREAEWVAAVGRGDAVDGSRRTLNQYMETWLDQEARHRVGPSTFAHYSNWIKGYIAPQLGHILIARLTMEHVRGLKSRLLDGPRQDGKPGGYAARTVRSILGLLHNILSDAEKYRAIPRNVADLVSAPRLERPNLTIWTAEQALTFISATTDNPYFAIWLAAMTGGLRRGEVLAMRWKYLNLATGQVTIRESLARQTGKGLKAGETKDRKTRTVLLPEICLDALRKHATRQKGWFVKARDVWPDTDYVFTTHVGTPLDPEQMVLAFHTARKALGLPHTRFHDLRHLHATLLLQAGTHMKVVSERLGHANIRMTMDTYTHVGTDLQQQAAAAMDTLFGQGLPQIAINS